MDLDENAINVYTDGSSKPGPRRGGIGFVVLWYDVDFGEHKEEFPADRGFSGATNNQMELEAVIQALKELYGWEEYYYDKIKVWTDSGYVVDNVNRAYSWKSNGWRNSSGRPIQNAAQWKELINLIDKFYKNKRIKVDIDWVKGHSKNQENKAVDKIAKQSADIKSKRKISTKSVRRKTFKESVTTPGSIPMRGQLFIIRIIEDEYQRETKSYRYRYEVLSQNSPDHKNIDFIYSNICVRSGHRYEVRVNEDQKYPQILEVIREVEKEELEE